MGNSNEIDNNEVKLFPDETEPCKITSHWLTNEFLIFATDVINKYKKSG